MKDGRNVEMKGIKANKMYKKTTYNHKYYKRLGIDLT